MDDAPPLRVGLITQLCHGSMAAVALGLNILPVYLLTLSHSFGGAQGLSKAQLGVLSSMAFTGLVLGILGSGPLADRWGSKLFVQLGNASTGLGLIGAAFAPTYATLCASLFLLGIGAGIFDMVLSPIVAVLHPERRTQAMNWLHAYYCIGAVATVAAGTICIAEGASWRTACLLLTPLPVGLLLAFAPLRLPRLTSQAGPLPVGMLLRSWWLWLALCAILLGGATEIGMVQWMPTYAQVTLRLSPLSGNLALLLFSLMMAFGRMLLGMLGGRISPFTALLIGASGCIVLNLLGSLLPVPMVALTACMLAGFTGSCLWPTILAVAADRFPDGGGPMFAALAACGNAGGMVMPVAIGAVADRWGLRAGLAATAAAPALLVPLVLLLHRYRTLAARTLPPAAATVGTVG